jgi:hypothetical protein
MAMAMAMSSARHSRAKICPEGRLAIIFSLSKSKPKGRTRVRPRMIDQE